MILRYQNLYSQYSRLEFTRPEDRPIAIDGIQNRLLSALGKNQKARGGFGVFDDGSTGGLLHRSLLWHRDHSATNTAFSRIVFPASRDRSQGVMTAPPSWSWMAYTGAIQYLEAPFNRCDWAKIQSPWSRATGGQPQQHHLGLSPALTTGGSDHIALIAGLYDVVSTTEANTKIYYDQPGGSQKVGLQGIIVAIRKLKGSQGEHDRLHYVVVVKPRAAGGRYGMKVYERIGVGEMVGSALVATGATIRVI